MDRSTHVVEQPARRLAVVLYAAALAGALALAASVFLTPWLASRNSTLAPPLYRAFSNVCHQVPARCFHLFGHPLAVCGRCVGIYIGILAGCLFFPVVRGIGHNRLPGRWVFPAFSLPLALDALGGGLRLWSSGIWVRFATGMVWGLVLPFFFLAALSGLARGKLALFRTKK